MAFKLMVVAALALACASASGEFGWRIVGGREAEESQFPYQISLRMLGQHSCGGSIIDETTILCAAHCVQGAIPLFMSVVVGSNTLKSGGTSYAISKIHKHTGYNARTIVNDISIIKLKEPIVFNKKVQPVKLPSADTGANEDLVLSGWGTTSYPGATPNKLQFIHLNSIDVETCKRDQTLMEVFETQVCTFTKSGEGACHGDSGGPLVNGVGEQVGIVSWGKPCAKGTPDVFTRVHSYLDWIEEHRK